MTLVALGFLLGMVGMLWMVVIEITQKDHQTKRERPRSQDKSLAVGAPHESKAA
jgi:hypothetical protein